MTFIKLSSRAITTPDSPMRRLAPHADAAKARGVKVYHLNIGDPDIEAPAQFLEGVRQFNSKLIGYEPSRGSNRLRQAWSRYFEKTNGVHLPPENFIITNGASEALQFAMCAAADPGEEVLVIDPVYANYLGIAGVGGVRLKPVLTTLEHGFVPPSVDAIRDVLSEKTRALLICNPNNPSGAVLTREFLLGALSLCRERGILLIVDETYREMVYDGMRPISILSLAPNDPHVVVVDSLSKRFSLCGARIGCFLSYNSDLVTAAYRMASARLAISSIDQYGAAHLLDTIGPDYVSAMTAEYESRRNTLCEALAQIPDTAFHRSQGTFYLIAKLPVSNSEEFALFMLKDFVHEGATTFVTPARGFYVSAGSGHDQVRIAFVLKKPDLLRAVEVLKRGLDAFS